MAGLFTPPFFDVGAGITPSDGALLYFNVVGSEVDKDTYTTAAATTPHANPVVANSKGVFPQIFLTGDYDWVLQDKNLVQQDTGSVSEFSTSSTIGGLTSYEFANVADMTTGTTIGGDIVTLTVGFTLSTQGYYTPGDGGGASYLVKATQAVDGFGNHTLVNTNTAILNVKEGIINVVQFGAKGDDTTDDYLPIQAANVAAVEYSNANVGGATILYPPLPYFVTGTISPLPAGENTLDRYNDQQSGGNVGRVENINIRGYGAKIRCTTATFVPSFPFCMMTLILAPSCSVKGLIFESDTNNQVADWFDSSDYFNRSVPTVAGEYGFVGIRSSGLKVQGNQFLHMEVALTITDDRDGAHTFPDSMLTYRTDVSGNYIYNSWTGLSMSNGSNEEWLIHHNNFEYTFLKIAQGSDQGRGIQFTNNTGRDISGIIFSSNDTLIESNTFNNLLGGFSFQPQGDGQLNYTFDINNMKLRNNICYSDHLTDVDDGAATIRPQGFVTFNASTGGTGAQQVTIKDFECSGNSVELWPVGGASTGAFMLRTGTADILFDSPSVENNTCMANNNAAALVTMAPVAAFTVTSFRGKFKFNGNKFERTVTGNANFEFQFMAGTFGTEATLEFNNNECRTLGANRQVLAGNFNRLIAKDNDFFTEEGTTTNALFWTQSVPKIEIHGNEWTKFSAAGNLGDMLLFDGIVNNTYDTILDSAVVRVSDNRETSGQFIFSSPLTYPASSHGLYEFKGNIIRNSIVPSNNVYPTSATFQLENIVNPAKTAPTATDVPLPTGYIVTAYTNVGAIGWQWNGAWTVQATYGAT